MIKIVTRRLEGATIQHTIEYDPTPGTYGSHLLLLDEYRLLQKSPKLEQLVFNTNFLRKMESMYGSLHCVYCGKKNLRIYHWNEGANRPHNMATADHFIPKSIDPETFAMFEDNLRVACYSCNNKKGSYIWDEKYPYPPYLGVSNDGRNVVAGDKVYFVTRTGDIVKDRIYDLHAMQACRFFVYKKKSNASIKSQQIKVYEKEGNS